LLRNTDDFAKWVKEVATSTAQNHRCHPGKRNKFRCYGHGIETTEKVRTITDRPLLVPVG